MSLDPRYMSQLEDQYEDAKETFYSIITTKLKDMIRVENSDDEDEKISFINKNMKEALAYVGLDDEDLSASYEDGLMIFNQVYKDGSFRRM
jgi:hypothetical protein